MMPQELKTIQMGLIKNYKKYHFAIKEIHCEPFFKTIKCVI